MAQLTLKFKDLVLTEFELAGGSKTIGREPSNDIVLENLLVSGYHARIDAAGKDYILTDLQSKNGTFVNGERVTSTKLKSGDKILIGKHTLVLGLDPAEGMAEPGLTEATMFMQVAQGPSEPSLTEAETAPEPSGALSDEQPAILSFVTGGTDEYTITKKLVKLGKAEEADVHIGGILTPKVAATISRRPTGYYITPMGRVKIKVNETMVKGSCRLRDFDIIAVGPVRLQFSYKS